MSTKRLGNISVDQKAAMIQYLQSHYQLLSGRFSKDFTFKHAQKQWVELSAILNAIPGGRKDWRHWRKAWHDMRTKVKSKRMKLNRLAFENLEGQHIEHLTASDELVAELISMAEGNLIQGTSQELYFKFEEGDVEYLDDEEDQDYNDVASVNKSEESNTLHAWPVPIIETKPLETIVTTDIHHLLENPIKVTTQKAATKPAETIRPVERTMTSSDQLVKLAEDKIKIKSDYYAKKLSLMRRDVEAKEKMADMLERLVELKEIMSHNVN